MIGHGLKYLRIKETSVIEQSGFSQTIRKFQYWHQRLYRVKIKKI